MLTNVTVAGIFDQPTFKSEMVTQSLLWEELTEINQKENWSQIKTHDEYEGWIHKFFTVPGTREENKNAAYLHTERLGVINKEPNDNASCIIQSVFGNELPAKQSCRQNGHIWHNIILPDNNEGWIKDAGYHPLKSIRATIIWTAEQLIGVPYVWGGRSSLGFDCSGFVQTVFKFCGISLPRNSGQQKNVGGLTEIKLEQAIPGDLIFFSESNTIIHVGIATDNGEFYHCAGDVRKESLIPGKQKYNHDLHNKLHCVMTIDSFIK